MKKVEISVANTPEEIDDVTIDIVIDHPVYGLIPFTASEKDVEEHGRELFARAKGGEFGVLDVSRKKKK